MYDKEAPQRYSEEQIINTSSVFEAHFLHRTEDHFKNLPKTIINNIGEVLIKANVPIEKRPALQISTALAQYIGGICHEGFWLQNSTTNQNQMGRERTDTKVHVQVRQYRAADFQSARSRTEGLQAGSECRIVI